MKRLYCHYEATMSHFMIFLFGGVPWDFKNNEPWLSKGWKTLLFAVWMVVCRNTTLSAGEVVLDHGWRWKHQTLLSRRSQLTALVLLERRHQASTVANSCRLAAYSGFCVTIADASHHCCPFTRPSVLELPAVWMTAPSLAFHSALPLTLKDSSCQMSKHFHHRLALPRGTPGLFLGHLEMQRISKLHHILIPNFTLMQSCDPS